MAAAAEPRVHVVAAGETLYGIARAYEVSVDAIIKANSLRDPSKLIAGTRLIIPGASADGASAAPGKPTAPSAIEYVVKPGDTLFGIAKAHGVSVDAVVKASGLSSSAIKAGQRLSIPAADPSGAGSAGDAKTAAKPAQTGSAAGAAGDAGKKPESSAASGGASAASTGAAAAGSTSGSAAGSTGGAKPAASVAAGGTPSGAGSKALPKAWPASGRVESLTGRLKGVSIAAGASAPIEAIRAGTVVSAGPFRGFSQVAFVQSADGLIYVYGGAVVLAVKVGEAVRKGTVIGRTGPNADANAYFFVFNKDSVTIDPETVPRD